MDFSLTLIKVISKPNHTLDSGHWTGVKLMSLMCQSCALHTFHYGVMSVGWPQQFWLSPSSFIVIFHSFFFLLPPFLSLLLYSYYYSITFPLIPSFCGKPLYILPALILLLLCLTYDLCIVISTMLHSGSDWEIWKHLTRRLTIVTRL